MTEKSKRRDRTVLLSGLPILAAAMLAPQDPDRDARTAPWPRAGEYRGQDACRECHDFEAEMIDGGVHRAVVASDATMGCETCHGPGAAHTDDPDGPRERITHPQKLTPAVQAELCGRCHGPESRGHGGGGVEGFLAAGLGCTDCHFVHEEALPPPMAGVRFRSRAASVAAAESTAPDECARCHPLQHRALEAGPHGTEGAGGDCTECHGHGSLHVATQGIARLITRPDVASDGVGTCLECHSDVDPLRAHWPVPGTDWLGGGATCFTCHRIHGAHAVEPEEEPKNAACVTCHALAFEAHVPPASVHGAMVDPAEPLATGCAGCHDGALEHARSGGRADLVDSLREAESAHLARTCLRCHEDEPALHGLHAGSHARHDVSCVDCHSASAPIGHVRVDAEANCALCHQAVAARFRLPNRHPLGDGAHMGCSDCHDPHAARPRLRDLRLREDRCVECHRAYRGPFVFEHQASRLDGCVVCHDPHGSSNRRMLHEATTQQNCLACHGDFPAFHDQTPGSVFTNCLNCHVQVHGSDHSRFFFR